MIRKLCISRWKNKKTAKVKRLSKNKKQFGESTPGAKIIESMEILITKIIMETKNTASQLRPVILDDFGIESAIEWYIIDFEKRTGISCVFKHIVKTKINNNEIETAIFRIFQETMNSICNHSINCKIEISLDISRIKILLKIKNRCIEKSKISIFHPKTLEIFWIKEQLKIFNGKLTITKKGKTEINMLIKIPLKKLKPVRGERNDQNSDSR